MALTAVGTDIDGVGETVNSSLQDGQRAFPEYSAGMRILASQCEHSTVTFSAIVRGHINAIIRMTNPDNEVIQPPKAQYNDSEYHVLLSLILLTKRMKPITDKIIPIIVVPFLIIPSPMGIVK